MVSPEKGFSGLTMFSGITLECFLGTLTSWIRIRWQMPDHGKFSMDTYYSICQGKKSVGMNRKTTWFPPKSTMLDEKKYI